MILEERRRLQWIGSRLIEVISRLEVKSTEDSQELIDIILTLKDMAGYDVYSDACINTDIEGYLQAEQAR